MKPNLDLLFPDTHNLKLLAVVDISSYPKGFRITHPNLEVTPPNFERVHLSFSPGGMNLYNSHNLGLTCGDECDLIDLPDGIWSMKYTIPPVADNYVEKTFLRVDQLKVRLERAFLCTNIDECDSDVKYQDMKRIDQIWFYIQGAIAEANQCNNMMAMKLYKLADGMITKFLNTK